MDNAVDKDGLDLRPVHRAHARTPTNITVSVFHEAHNEDELLHSLSFIVLAVYEKRVHFPDGPRLDEYLETQENLLILNPQGCHTGYYEVDTSFVLEMSTSE
ncbi:hypothetical protein FRC20_003763 [Serendipita sp. 405]|nr:hypothetical protein FRC16_010748 [Serendipita sp. 398]KAG8843714.1 hypothetical protein FRC20_003763 [Serendipita sp. 405]